MGSRVNYVVVRDGGYTVYAQGGGAGHGIDYNFIDVDRRVLLLFNTVYNSVVYRAAMLQAYAATWPGWEIRWAYDGVADLMAYVGVDSAGAQRLSAGADRAQRVRAR